MLARLLVVGMLMMMASMTVAMRMTMNQAIRMRVLMTMVAASPQFMQSIPQNTGGTIGQQ
jgi:hypothetical protein